MKKTILLVLTFLILLFIPLASAYVCYQETATTQPCTNDGSTDLPGNYSNTGTWDRRNGVSNTYDGNYNTYGVDANTDTSPSILYVNYYRPGLISNESINYSANELRYRASTMLSYTTVNLADCGPGSGETFPTYSFRITSNAAYFLGIGQSSYKIECKDTEGSYTTLVFSVGATGSNSYARIYEEGIEWNIYEVATPPVIEEKDEVFFINKQNNKNNDAIVGGVFALGFMLLIVFKRKKQRKK